MQNIVLWRMQFLTNSHRFHISAARPEQHHSNGSIVVGDGMHSYTSERLVQSTPGSPQDRGRPNSIEVVGSADSLVERVCIRFNLLKSSNILIELQCISYF